MDACKKKVLCVDDSPAVLSVCKDLLEDNGFEALTVADGASALELLAQHPHGIDIAVLDYELPGMTGLPLAESIKKLSPNVAVVMFSGSPPREGSSSPWIDFVLNKAEGISALLRVIHDLIDAKRDRGMGAGS